MLLAIVSIIVGLAVLIAGAEGMVRGAASLAARLNVSPLVIGLTIVSFGTSAPELTVNLIAAFNGSPELAIGNVVGSSIANILLVLGVSALIVPLTVKASTVYKEIPFALLGISLIFVMVNDKLFDGASANVLSRTDGIALISLMGIFMYYIYGLASDERRRQKEITEEGSKAHKYDTPASLLLVAGGMAGLILGGRWLVNGAITVASAAGLSESLIGLSVVAIGTSLPELVTSIVAALKKHSDIAIGNAVGSNIFNVFFVLGTTSTILPLSFSSSLKIDVVFAVVAMVMLFAFMFIGSKHKLTKFEGSLLLTGYVSYILFLIIRG
jgi:cation:H+ antiporter